MAAVLELLTRTVRRYLDDGMTERAPTLAYYGVLSLFPALLLAFAVLRFVAGDGAATDIARYAREHGASGAVSGAVRSAVGTAQDVPAGTAGAAGVASLLTLIYGASRAFTAAGRAVDAIGHRSRRPRSIVRRAEDVGWTLALLFIGVVMIVLGTVSGRVLDELLKLLGLGGAAGTIWEIMRWPVAAFLLVIVVAVVRWAAPTAARPRFRAITPGILVTVGALVVATAGFNLYVTYLASYNATYGAFAGAVILMLWLWLAGSALLFGAELDAVLAEGRATRQQPDAPRLPAVDEPDGARTPDGF